VLLSDILTMMRQLGMSLSVVGYLIEIVVILVVNI